MKIDEHIKNLEEYCQDDDLFEKDGDFKEFCDNHIADIKAVIQELKNTQSDLYEANNRITDLLLILGDRDRMIDLMITWISENENPFDDCYENSISCADIDCKDCIRKYFEERCR